jgi:hypothetical protein
MKIYHSTLQTPVRRDLIDARSAGGPAVPASRKPVLNDRRSTR